jgi:hypothetical protein
MYNIPMSTVLVGGPPPAPYTPVAAADSSGAANGAVLGGYPHPGLAGPEGCHPPPYGSPPQFPVAYYQPPPGVAPMSHPYSQYAYLPYTAQQTGASVEGTPLPYPVYQYPVNSRPNSTTPVPPGHSSEQTAGGAAAAAGGLRLAAEGGSHLSINNGRRIEEEAPASGGATPSYAAVAVESPTQSSLPQTAAAVAGHETDEAVLGSQPAAATDDLRVQRSSIDVPRN